MIAVVLFAGGMAWLLRGEFWGRSLGDNSDGGIVVAILEHWWRVFSLQAPGWRSPGWYWPAPHALGYSDSLFLLALPYAAARALGAGWFVASDAAVATLATAGFWGMVLLVRRSGGPAWIGAVVAAMFSFGAVPLFKLGHMQTYTVQLAPWLGLALVARPALWAAAGGVLYALMFLTAAQTPWFLGLVAGMAGVFALPWIRPGLWRIGAWFVAGWAVGMAPFAAFYRDSFRLGRDWAAAHFYSGRPHELVAAPPGEWLWPALAPGPGRPEPEIGLGLTPVLAVAALLAAVWLLERDGFASAQSSRSRTLFASTIQTSGGSASGHRARERRRAAAALIVAGLAAPMLAVDWGGVEPWRLVFALVPGGSAVRTPFRIELAAQFFVLLGLGIALGLAWSGGAARATLLVLMAVLLVEQGGDGVSRRDTAAMERWLGAARRPEFACTAFYLLPGDGTEPWHEYQSDAMLLSQKLGMPTINGNSSFYPPGWDLSFVDRPDYAGKALAWIDAHGARGEVCGADPRRGVWVPGVEGLTGQPGPATPLP